MSKMCSEIFENPCGNPDVHPAEAISFLFRHLERESTSSSSSSSWLSMSGYGNINRVQGAAGPFSSWSIVAPVQWTNTSGLNHRPPSCMPPKNEAAAPSSSSTSFSGFHRTPLQFPYDRLRQHTGLDSAYGTKSGVALHDYRESSSRILQQHHRQLMSSGMIMDVLPGDSVNVGKMTAQEIIDAKALAASKSHSEAERRRRERINSHLATLRSLLPSTTKTDKASLLAEVIEHVKDLKRQAAEIAEGSTVPTEADEVTVDPDPSCSEGKMLIKASVCCNDRPDLLSDLMKALGTLKLRTLKAEITTLGGRVKNILLIDVCPTVSTDDGNASPPSLTCIHDALKAVMERPNSEESPQANKRQRLNPFNSAHLLDQRSI